MNDISPNEDLGYLLDADEWDNRVYETKHECLNQWLKRKDATNRCSRRSLNEYSRAAARFFHHVYPDTHPTEITVGDIEQWVIDLNDRDLTDNTKRRYVESLSSFYEWAMKRPRFDEITGNPAGIVLEELPRDRRERPESATWENGKRVIRHIGDPRDKAIAVVLAKTGCRVQEAVQIKKDHLDLENGFVRLEDWKGGVTTRNPVDQETIALLRQVQVLNDSNSEWLFPSSTGSHIKRERVRRQVRDAAVNADVMDEGENRWHHKFTPHYYRTIWTTLMRNHSDAMSERFVGYLRGDKGDIKDHYTSKQPFEQIREEYLEAIKTLNVML